jgi:hypothetical protein
VVRMREADNGKFGPSTSSKNGTVCLLQPLEQAGPSVGKSCDTQSKAADVKRNDGKFAWATHNDVAALEKLKSHHSGNCTPGLIL